VSGRVLGTLLVLGLTAPSLSSPAQQALPPRTRLVEARALVEAGELSDAELVIRHYLAAQPESAEAHFLLGYILFREIQADAHSTAGGAHSTATRARAQASLAAFAEGSRYRDLDAFDLKIAALDQTLVGDLVSADRLLTRSVAKNPSDAEAWYYLGRTKYNEDRFEEAVHAFQKCLAVEPRHVKAQDNLGLSYAALGRAEEAIAAYEAAIDWQTTSGNQNPGPFLNLGTLLLEQNRPREAVSHLQRAVELAPTESRGHEQLGKTYLQLDDVSRGLSELETAVQLDPESAPLHYMLGHAYRRAGVVDKAKAELAVAARLNGNRARH
jgi:tetratricopeptide (TPR) repeat protein